MSNHDEEILAKQKEIDLAYEELKNNRKPVTQGETFRLTNISMHEDEKQLQVETGGNEYVIQTLEGQDKNYVGVKAKETGAKGNTAKNAEIAKGSEIESK